MKSLLKWKTVLFAAILLPVFLKLPPKFQTAIACVVFVALITFLALAIFRSLT